VITGHECRRSLYCSGDEWHRERSMSELRELRRSVDLGQREFAALLSVPLETLRTWDSGRRAVSTRIMQRAAAAVATHKQRQELLPLDQLANELGVHIRTLQAAARTGRL
jgi:transcriptional regulator with XRE-family HTH domain